MSNLGSTTAAMPASSSPTRYDAQPRSSWVIWRKIIAGWESRDDLLTAGLGAWVESQVGVAGGDDHVLVLAAVVDDDLAFGDADQGAVATIDGLPHRASHGGDAVAAVGLVLAAVVGGPQRADHALGLRASGAGGGATISRAAVVGSGGDLAADVAERTAAQNECGHPVGGLADLELRARERSGLRRAVGKAVDERDHALVGVDERADGDARCAGQRHEPAVGVADQHLTGGGSDEDVGAHVGAELDREDRERDVRRADQTVGHVRGDRGIGRGLAGLDVRAGSVVGLAVALAVAVVAATAAAVAGGVGADVAVALAVAVAIGGVGRVVDLGVAVALAAGAALGIAVALATALA